MTQKLYTLILLVKNEPGVLHDITKELLSSEENINSITAGKSEDPECTRITLTLYEPSEAVMGILKDKSYLVRMRDVTEDLTLDRELFYARMEQMTPAQEAKVILLSSEYGAVLHRGEKEGRLLMEYCGMPEEVDKVQKALEKMQSIERMMRSGRMSMRLL